MVTVIIWLMLSVSLCYKVITLSSFQCICSSNNLNSYTKIFYYFSNTLCYEVNGKKYCFCFSKLRVTWNVHIFFLAIATYVDVIKHEEYNLSEMIRSGQIIAKTGESLEFLTWHNGTKKDVMTLSLSSSVSLFLSLFHCLSSTVSFSHSLCLSFSHSLSLCLSVSHPISLFLCLSLCICLSVSLSLCPSLCPSLSFSHSHICSRHNDGRNA